ncbi:sorting nexin [Anaeramoeba flamelloides]|uniref:Sorting nexin n=1 Tax=Anaeramoeba flamelloides TaxID=1746091 RepID=A0ABQ8YP19_9EUKA|nr:sorting nexin [Anaeramoeba flamelloides]
MDSLERKAIAVYNFNSSEENEISISYGDIVIVLEEDPSGWWIGKVGHEIGFFPKNCIKYINTDEEIYNFKSKTTTPNQSVNIENFRILNNYCWEKTGEPFQIQIKKSEKRGKYKGIKKYTVYEVISGNNRVLRRYKHFLWLRSRLIERYDPIQIAPLPEKQLQGRFTEDFIEKRRQALGRFLNQLSHHPVLCTCPILKHFLHASDFNKWKRGKRKFEKENKSGFNLYQKIDLEKLTNPSSEKEINLEISAFVNHLHEIEKKLRLIEVSAFDLINDNYQDFSNTTLQLGSSWKSLTKPDQEYKGFTWKEPTVESINLESKIYEMGINLENIGNLWMNQSNIHYNKYIQIIKKYIQCSQVFLETLKKYEKLDFSQKNSSNKKQKKSKQEQLQKISAIIKTEVDLFYRNRVSDFKWAMKEYAENQISFHLKIISLWENFCPYDEENNINNN